jgi:hypothetical protein
MRKPVDQAVKKIIAGLFYPLEFAPTSLFSGPMLPWPLCYSCDWPACTPAS